MNTWLVRLLSAGLLLLPAVAWAQDNFSGQWHVPGSTQLADIGVSPFGSAAVITQTADVISWQMADTISRRLGDDRARTIRLNESSVIDGQTFTARWVQRALLLEARRTLPDGRVVTSLQILLRNANDELELVSVVTPLPRGDQTAFVRVVYQRRK